MSEQPYHFIDPATLARIDNYALIARNIVEGFVTGLHRSLYHGFGSEFVQYREYSKGDDLKYIDWKVFARHDKYQMKVFQEETNTNCYIVLDTSTSMAYEGRTSGISKIRYGKILAACIAYMVNRQGDNVGFYAYNDRLKCGIRPSHKSGHVHRICAQLASLEPEGICNHEFVFNYLGENFNRRGLIVLISDFLDTDVALLKAVRHFRYSHHDCIMFQILDDDELDFPFDATIRFIDSESADEIVTSPEIVRDQYVEQLNAYLRDLEKFCLDANIDYQRMRTSNPLANALSAYLSRREIFQ